MRVLDANVVLAAHRDDHPHFAVARAYIDELVASGASFCLPDIVAATVVRLATNRRIFTVPTPVPDAFAYLRALRSQPGHVLLGPGAGHLDLLEELCVGFDAGGDLVPDAQLAALALEHACEIVSFDRDFSRFETVRWSRPA